MSTKQYWVTVPKMIEQTILVDADTAKEAKYIADTVGSDDPRVDYVGFEVTKTFKASKASKA